MVNGERRLASSRAWLVALVFLLLIGAGFQLKNYKDNHNLEWVTYDGRTYLKSGIQIDRDKLSSAQLDLFNQRRPTGVRTKGMNVYRVGDSPYAPTVIYLQSQEGNFFTYVLSGGP